MQGGNPKNYLLLFFDMILFTNAMAFLSVNTIITYFLTRMGATTFEVSLANALLSIGAFVSQPVFARTAMSLPQKQKVFSKILMTQRFFLFAFVATIPWLSTVHPHWTVSVFLVCWGVFSFFTGAYAPFYMSLFAKVVAQRQRGKLRGVSGAAANIIAIATAYLIGVVLKGVAFPWNYTLLFGLGALLLLVDAWVFWVMVEEPDNAVKVDMNYFHYFMRAPRVLASNRPLARIILGFTLMVLSQVSLVYDALYAIRIYHAGAAQIAAFTALSFATNIVGSFSFGFLADKYSHRRVLAWAAVCGALGGLPALGLHGMFVVYAAFAFANLGLTGYNLSSGVLIIENSRPENIAMNISVNVMVTLLTSSLLTLASSFIVQAFSFQGIFAIPIIAGGLALFVFQRGKTRPLNTSAASRTDS